jgi:hypothetical protein
LPLWQKFRSNVVDAQPEPGLDSFASGNDLQMDSISGPQFKAGLKR